MFLYLNGLWRNLPVRSELGEEEPAGCGAPDKGGIYTLTLDLWGERRGRQLERTLNSGTTFFFRVLENLVRKGRYVFVSYMVPCVRGETSVSERRVPYAAWSVWECVG